MNLSDEIRKQIEKNKELKLAVGEINNHLSVLEGLTRKDIMEQVDEAYQRGLENGKQATFALVADASNAEYQRGLDDAWEAARKLFSSMADSDIEKVFHTEWNNGGFNALINLQPQEVIAKLKAYEEQKTDNCIEIGDEVRLCRHKVPYIVTSCDGDDDTYILITVNGGFIKAEKYNVRKTGRHFDIASILKDMKHD